MRTPTEPAASSRRATRVDSETSSPTSRRAAVLIMGMHRSGTSYVSGLMPALGLAAPAGRLQFSNRGNVQGNREVRELARVNEWLLYSVGSTWDAPSPSLALADQIPFRRDVKARAQRELESRIPPEGSWYWKDPRLSLVSAAYRPVIGRFASVVVLVHRPPMEVARSLASRSGLPVAVGVALWELYNAAALRSLDDAPHSIVVSFDDALAAPTQLLEQVRGAVADQAVGLSSPSPELVASWADASQRHHRVPDDAELPPEVKKLAATLGDLARGTVSGPVAPRTLSASTVRILRDRARQIPPWLPPGPWSLMRHGVTLEEQGIGPQVGRVRARVARELAGRR